MSTNENTHIYLLYYHEDITPFLKDPRIKPLKLEPQTEYLESQSFRLIKENTIPSHIEYVGFITPSYFKKSRKKLIDIKHQGENNTIYGYFRMLNNTARNVNYIELTKYFHPYFRELWDWLLNEMGFNPKGYKYNYNHFYSNMWLMDKKHFLMYLVFVRKAMNILDNAPYDIKRLLWSDAKYGGNIPKERLIEIFGNPHYTYHPFLIERLVIFFSQVHNLTLK